MKIVIDTKETHYFVLGAFDVMLEWSLPLILKLN